MYTTPWCGYCHRLKGQLDREGIAFDVVDIEQHPEAAQIVESANNGNQTVPTLVYADGTAQTNPSLAQVKAASSPAADRLDAVVAERRDQALTSGRAAGRRTSARRVTG